MVWCLTWLTLSFLATYAWLRCSPQGALFSTLCLTCLFLFWGALLNQLVLTSQLLSIIGPTLGLSALLNQNTRARIKVQLLPYLPWIGLIIGVAYLFSRNQTLSSIDEPIYWAIVGKYLFLFDHLPISDALILPKHLRYLPGLGLLHYHFYQLIGHYDLQLAFFAQGLLLLSVCLLLIRQPKNTVQMSLFLMAFLILHLFFGTILARLDVDYLLAAVFFIILWHLFTTKPLTLPLEQTCAILLLPLIKIPGVYFALVALVLYYDAYHHQHSTFKSKTLGILLLMLALNQLLWHQYADLHHLGHFRAPITWQEIKQAFLPNPTMWHAISIFLRDAILGPADRLNFPYLSWYALVGFLVLKKMDYKKHQRFFILLLSTFLIYGIQLYGLQFFAFGVGSSRQDTVALTRYLNTFWVPIMMLASLYIIQKQGSLFLKRPAVFCSLILMSTLSLLIMHQHHASKRQANYVFANDLAMHIAPLLHTLPTSKIFLLTKYEQDNISWQLNYHLLTLRHHYQGYEPLIDSQTQRFISESDYLLVYEHPDCHLANGLYQVDPSHYPQRYCDAPSLLSGLTLVASIKNFE